MAEAKDKTVWERIAELGFAEAVESRSFKRVGKTRWRLDGDGIVHHVKLYRGFSVEPGSFRDLAIIYLRNQNGFTGSERTGQRSGYA